MATDEKKVKITVFTTTECSETVAYFLEEITDCAVTVYDVRDLDECGWDYVEKGLRESFGQEVRAVAFCKASDEARVLGLLDERLKSVRDNLGETCGSLSVETELVSDVDWLKEWQKGFKPVVLGDVCICPKWLTYDGDCKHVLKIESGVAFGTGYHETTSQCLLLAQNYDFSGKTVLDMGCGSGVLGLSALLLGAERATLVDFDSQAVEATKANAEFNGLADRCDVVCGDLTEKVNGKFDFCFANLTADILKRLAETLTEFLADDACVSLSGILVSLKGEVRDVFEKLGFSLLSYSELGEWCALYMKFKGR